MSRPVRKHSPPALPDLDKEAAALSEAIEAKLTYVWQDADTATDNDWYQATALAVRDRIVDIWLARRRETKHNRRSGSIICRSNS